MSIFNSRFLSLLRFGHDPDDPKIHVVVTRDRAMQVSPFYAGVTVLSQSVAQLPLVLIRKKKDGTRHREMKHSIYDLLRYEINRNLTSYDWRIATIKKMIFDGNSFTKIIRGSGGDVQALEFIDHTSYKYLNLNEIQIKTTKNETLNIKRDDFIHFKYSTTNGIDGDGIYDNALKAIGFLIACEDYGTEFFTNSAIPHIVLIHPRELSQEAEGNILRSWRNKILKRRFDPAILQEGIDLKEIKVPNKESQFLELRNQQISELARFFRITPHKLQDLERATFSNVVELNQSFVIDTLMPLTVNIEQTLKKDLLRNEPELFAEFLFEELLRGAIRDRYEAYRTAIMNRFLSVDEVRAMENKNPLTDEEIERNQLQLQKNDGNILNRTNPDSLTGRESTQ